MSLNVRSPAPHGRKGLAVLGFLVVVILGALGIALLESEHSARGWLAWLAFGLAVAAGFAGLWLAARLMRSNAALHALVRRLEYQANHDSLTGLASRARFIELLERNLVRAARDGAGRCAVVFLDLDDFKRINDRHGHTTGDRVLAAVAGRLEDAVRPGDVIGRLGGDELAVLLEGVQRHDEAEHAADRITAAIAQPLIVDGVGFQLSASAGVAVSDVGDTAEDVLREADVAMYRVKLAA